MSHSGAPSHCNSLRSSAGDRAAFHDRVLVVGAGVAGLQAARTLLQAGLKVTILEESTAIGGCWASCDKDAELQCPWQQYAFPDFPWPAQLSPSADAKATAAQVLAYVTEYAHKYDLIEHVRFSSRLLKLTRETVKSKTGSSTRWLAVFKDLNSKKHLQMYGSHVVVATGLHTNAYTPTYPGQTGFLGEQVHARHVTAQHDFDGKDVLVVGNSFTIWDTLADCAVARQARSVSLLYRKVPWPIPTTSDLGSLRIDTINAAKLTGVPHYTARAASKVSCSLDAPFRRMASRKAAKALKEAFDMKEAAVQPSQPLEESLLLSYQPVGSKSQWAASARHRFATMLQGRVRCFTPEGVLLDTGEEVPADCVLYCTGFSQKFPFFTPKISGLLGSQDDGLYLYRSMVHPEVRNLAFVGCTADTTNALLTSGMQAEWLVRLMICDLRLPTRQEMHADIQAQRCWHRAHLPACHDRSTHVGLYTQQYLDQLAHDMHVAQAGGCWPNQKQVPLHERYANVFPQPQPEVCLAGLQQPLASYVQNLRARSMRLSFGSVMELDDVALQKMRITRDTQDTGSGIQVSPSMIVNNFGDGSSVQSTGTSSNGATPPSKPNAAKARFSAGLLDDDLALQGRNVSFSNKLVLYGQDGAASSQPEPPPSPLGVLRQFYSSVTGSDPRASGASAAHTSDTNSGSSGPQSALGHAMHAMRLFFKSHWTKSRASTTGDLTAPQRHESCTHPYTPPEPAGKVMMSSRSFTAGVTHQRGHGRSRLSGTATHSNTQLGDVMPMKPQKSAASLTHSSLARHAALTAGLLAYQASEDTGLTSPRQQLSKRASSPGRVLQTTMEQPHHAKALRSVTGLTPTNSARCQHAPGDALQGRTSGMSNGSGNELKSKLSQRSSSSIDALTQLNASVQSVGRSSSRDGQGSASGHVHRLGQPAQPAMQMIGSEENRCESHSTWSIAEELFHGNVMHTFPPVLDVVAEGKEEENMSVVSKTSDAGASEVFGSQPSITGTRAQSSSGFPRSNNLVKVSTGNALASVFASKSLPLMAAYGGAMAAVTEEQAGRPDMALDAAVVVQDLDGPASGFSAATHEGMQAQDATSSATITNDTKPQPSNPTTNRAAPIALPSVELIPATDHVRQLPAQQVRTSALGPSSAASAYAPSTTTGQSARAADAGSTFNTGASIQILTQTSDSLSSMELLTSKTSQDLAASTASLRRQGSLKSTPSLLPLASVSGSHAIGYTSNLRASFDMSFTRSSSRMTGRSSGNAESSRSASQLMLPSSPPDAKLSAMLYCHQVAGTSASADALGLSQHRGRLLVQQQEMLQQQQQQQCRTARADVMPLSLHQSFTSAKSRVAKPDNLSRSSTSHSLVSIKSVNFGEHSLLDMDPGEQHHSNSSQLRSMASKDEMSMGRSRHYHSGDQKGDSLIDAAVKQAESGSVKNTRATPSGSGQARTAVTRSKSRLGEDGFSTAAAAASTPASPGGIGVYAPGPPSKRGGGGSNTGDGTHVTWAVPDPRTKRGPSGSGTPTAAFGNNKSGGLVKLQLSRSNSGRSSPTSAALSAATSPGALGVPPQSLAIDNLSAASDDDGRRSRRTGDGKGGQSSKDSTGLLPARERLQRRLSIEAEIFSTILQDGQQTASGPGDADESPGDGQSPTGGRSPSPLTIIQARQDLRRRSMSGKASEDGGGQPPLPKPPQHAANRSARWSATGGSLMSKTQAGPSSRMPAMCTDRFNEILSMCGDAGSGCSHGVQGSGASLMIAAHPHTEDMMRTMSTTSKSTRFSLTGVAAAINSAINPAAHAQGPSNLGPQHPELKSYDNTKLSVAALRAPSGTAQLLGFSKGAHSANARGSTTGTLDLRSESMTMRRPPGIAGQLDAAAQGLLNVVADKAQSGTTQPQSYAEKSYTALLRNMALGLEPGS